MKEGKRGMSLFFCFILNALITEKKIQDLIDEVLAPEQFIVVLDIQLGNKIYIELDNVEKATSITDCIKMSRQVEHNLDRETEDFSLEVTSPGLDKPFRVFKQYVKNIGRPVIVKRIEGEKLEGTLLIAEEDHIIIETKEKKRIEGRKAKEWVIEEVNIPMSEIKETLVKIVF
jgi:ribosome maturation factor RimP